MSTSPVHVPAHRLAGFYFFYYATVGAFMPYWSPYLEARGFNGVQMGVAFALMGLMRTFVPMAWGTLADRTGKRMVYIRWAAAASLITFMGIPYAPTIFWVGVLMMAYTLFWHALLPQFEAVALGHLAARGGDYPRVRLWGSVGFVASVLGLGWALDRVGIIQLPWLVGAMWVGMAVMPWFVPDTAVTHHADAPHGSIWDMLRRPEVRVLLLVCLCSQLSFAPYYNFFTLFLERHGHTRTVAGVLWSIAVVAEIGVFMLVGRAIANFGARRLMVIAMGATALRWVMIGFGVESWTLLILAQLSHAITFGAYHALAMHYVQRLFPAWQQGRAQALYNAAAYGVGGSIGGLVSGVMWEGVQRQQIPSESLFVMAAAVAAAGFWLAWKKLPEA